MKFALIKSIPLFDAGMIPTFGICGMIFLRRYLSSFYFDFTPIFFYYSFFFVVSHMTDFEDSLRSWDIGRRRGEFIILIAHESRAIVERERYYYEFQKAKEGNLGVELGQSCLPVKRAYLCLCVLLCFPFSCTHTIPSEN